MIKYLLHLILFVTCSKVVAIELYNDFPGVIKANERYVFYSHGKILEGNDPRPQHPEFGIYEFVKIKEALFDNGGFNLIAHHRPANTDFTAYVQTLENWVQTLLEAGVKPSHITLVGFSRGGQLTAFAADKLNNTGINTALLGTCVENEQLSALAIGGNLLSILETSDVMTSCAALKGGEDILVSFEEISITTGLKHGAFYQPLDDWMGPLKKWIRQTNR